MATVTIGGRELVVWSKKDDGSLGKLRRVVLAEQALQEADGAGVYDALAALVLCYVGENEGVTVGWLLEVLPADAGDVIKACVAAIGTGASAGEAKSP